MKRLPSLKQLQYLVALADTQHFGRAAERCHITQSTLSAGIRDLEAVLETLVAERTKRHVVMTPVGRQIAARAKVLLRDAEELMEVAMIGRAPMSGPMHLGVIPTIGPFLLPRVLPALNRSYPDLRLYLREQQTDPLLDRLREGELDIALIALPYDTAGLSATTLFNDEFFFACNHHHRLATSAAVSVQSLEREPLLLLEEGHCLRGQALAICSATPRRTRAQFEATSLHTLVPMVAAGVGVTLLPKLAVDTQLVQGADISLARLDPPAFRQIGLVWREGAVRAEDYQLLAEGIKVAIQAT